MKTTKTIEVPAKVVKREAKTKEVVTYTCDVCDKSVDKSEDNRYGSGMSACSMCGRDICRRSKTGNSGWPKSCYVEHPEDHGDYPRKMCMICEPLWYSLYDPMQKNTGQKKKPWRNESRKKV